MRIAETPPGTPTNLLVTAVGRRVYVIEELLRAAGPHDRLFVTDMDPSAPALHVPGSEVLPARSVENLQEWVVRLATRHSLTAVMSLHDYENVRLADAATALAAQGVTFIGPGSETAKLLIDKYAQYTYLRRRLSDGLVPTYPESSWGDPRIDRAGVHGWVIKDRFGSGSSGLAFASSWPEAVQACRENKRTAGMDADMNSAPMESVIQPRVAGHEYNVDVFLDRAGSISGICVKKKMRMRNGETDAAEVLIDPPHNVTRLATQVASLLDATGNLDIDIIESPSGAAFVIDINPRFGGGYAFSARAGYEAAEAIWTIAANQELKAHLGPERQFRGSKYVDVMAWRPGARDA